jgi:hypothetical protein
LPASARACPPSLAPHWPTPPASEAMEPSMPPPYTRSGETGSAGAMYMVAVKESGATGTIDLSAYLACS